MRQLVITDNLNLKLSQRVRVEREEQRRRRTSTHNQVSCFKMGQVPITKANYKRTNR